MIHQVFSTQIATPDGSKLDRNMSPFCPIDIENDANWITGCFVSPTMLIASPLFLVDKHGRKDKEL